MRLLHNVNESSGKATLLEILTLIYEKCQPFLKDIVAQKSQFKKLPYSGRNNNNDYFIKSVRTEREPKDMDGDIHEFLDQEFNKKFGFRARSNAIFATGFKVLAAGYGSNTYVIFPIGNYKFVYSDDIKDLYMAVDKVAGKEAYHRWSYANDPDMRKQWTDEATTEWEDIYGEGKDGDWEYDGVFIHFIVRDYHPKNRAEAKKAIIDSIKKLDNDDIMAIRLDQHYENPQDARKFLVSQVKDHEVMWLPEVDLDTYIDGYLEEAERETNNPERYNEWKMEEVKNWFDIDDYYNRGIVSAINSDNEIMIHCDQYLAVYNNRYSDKIVSYIKTNGMKAPGKDFVG